MPLRVLHLVGSAVSDFFADLSRLYAADCLRATADPARYEFVIAYVSPDRSWRFPSDLSDRALAAAPARTFADGVAYLAGLRVDVAVPQMFCLPGMTTYRSLLSLLDIPVLGNPPEVMAVAADKSWAKAVVSAAGVAVPAGQTVVPGEPVAIATPAVVKPVDSDNSAGLTLVREPAAFPAAVAAACEHAGRALVETYVELGREVRCGVMEIDGNLACLPLEEYPVSHDAPLRTAAQKLARDDNGLRLVAKDPSRAWIVDPADPATAPVHAAARACYLALGCRDYGLFDFRIDPDGNPWFLEAGLYCSFAEKSVLAVMARAAGIPVADLFAQAIYRALTRGESRSSASPLAVDGSTRRPF